MCESVIVAQGFSLSGVKLIRFHCIFVSVSNSPLVFGDKFLAVGIDITLTITKAQTEMSCLCVTEKYLTSERQLMFNVSVMRSNAY